MNKEKVLNNATQHLIGFTFQELKIFHTNYFKEKYKGEANEFIQELSEKVWEKRFEYWRETFKKTTNYIVAKPTKEVLLARLKVIKSQTDCTDALYAMYREFLLNMLDNYFDLGNSDAYIELANQTSEIREIKPYKTFKLKGDIKAYYPVFIEYQVIDHKTSLNCFKKAFSGTETTEIGLINLVCPKTTFAGLIQLLKLGDCFEKFPPHFHKVTENITGETDFKNALGKWRALGTFKSESQMRELAKKIQSSIK